MTLSPLAATRAWVETFVVAHNVCPFAGRELAHDSIRYVEVDASDWEVALMTLIEECRLLDETPAVETTLLVLSQGVEEFEEYLDLLALGEELMAEQGFEGVYQLASFHPDYCFEGAAVNDAANFTNRSPWPMLHLLREASIEEALAHYPDPAAIPERNIAEMRRLGHDRLAEALNAVRDEA